MELGHILVGLVAGAVVGLTSTGGGAILTPALILVLGVPPSVAVGSDVFIAAVMKLVGGGVYAARREVDWRLVARLAAGSVPGAGIGALLLRAAPPGLVDATLGRAVGTAVALAGLATILRLLRKGPGPALEMPSTAKTVALGLLAGVIVSVTSIGSGSLLICVLTLFFPLPPRTLVGTDIVHALFLSAAATVGHLAAGRVDFALAAAVLAGAIPGVLVGTQVAKVAPEKALRVGLALVLITLGSHLAITGGTKKPAREPAVVAAGGRG